MKNTVQMYELFKFVIHLRVIWGCYLILFQNFIISFKDCLHFKGFHPTLIGWRQAWCCSQRRPTGGIISHTALLTEGVGTVGADDAYDLTAAVDGLDGGEQEHVDAQGLTHADAQTVGSQGCHLARASQAVSDLGLHVGLHEVDEVEAVVLGEIRGQGIRNLAEDFRQIL